MEQGWRQRACGSRLRQRSAYRGLTSISSEKYKLRQYSVPGMGRVLGLPAGELTGEANVMRLSRLPSSDEFELRGYTHTPAG